MWCPARSSSGMRNFRHQTGCFRVFPLRELYQNQISLPENRSSLSILLWPVIWRNPPRLLQYLKNWNDIPRFKIRLPIEKFLFFLENICVPLCWGGVCRTNNQDNINRILLSFKYQLKGLNSITTVLHSHIHLGGLLYGNFLRWTSFVSSVFAIRDNIKVMRDSSAKYHKI